jgi:hypothetical protein
VLGLTCSQRLSRTRAPSCAAMTRRPSAIASGSRHRWIHDDIPRGDNPQNEASAQHERPPWRACTCARLRHPFLTSAGLHRRGTLRFSRPSLGSIRRGIYVRGFRERLWGSRSSDPAVAGAVLSDVLALGRHPLRALRTSFVNPHSKSNYALGSYRSLIRLSHRYKWMRKDLST